MLSTRSQLPLPSCHNCAMQPLRVSPARSIAPMGGAAIADRTANAARRHSPAILLSGCRTSRCSGSAAYNMRLGQTADLKVHYGNDVCLSNCQETPRNARNRTFQFLFEHLMFEICAAFQFAKAKVKYTNLQAAKKIQHNSAKVVRLSLSGHTSVPTMALLKQAV